MKSERRIRLALIGTGMISGAHVRGILANPDRYEVTAVCSRNATTRAGIVEALGGGAAQFDAWDPMLQEHGDRLPIEGDAAASVAVLFANGALGEITATWAFRRPYGAYRYHVIGEKGQLFGSDFETCHLPEGEEEPRREQHPKGSEWPAAFRAFADGVAGSGLGLPDAREGRRVLDFVLRASAGMP